MRWNQPAKFIFNKTNGSYPQIVRLQKLIDTNLDSMISKYKRTPLTPFHILLQKMQYHYLAILKHQLAFLTYLQFFFSFFNFYPASLLFIFLLSPFSSLYFFVGFAVENSFLYFSLLWALLYYWFFRLVIILNWRLTQNRFSFSSLKHSVKIEID